LCNYSNFHYNLLKKGGEEDKKRRQKQKKEETFRLYCNSINSSIQKGLKIGNINAEELNEKKT